MRQTKALPLLISGLLERPIKILLSRKSTHRRNDAVEPCDIKEISLGELETDPRIVFPLSCQPKLSAITTKTVPQGESWAPHDRVLFHLRPRQAWLWSDQVSQQEHLVGKEEHLRADPEAGLWKTLEVYECH